MSALKLRCNVSILLSAKNDTHAWSVGKNMVLEQDKDAQYGPSTDAWNLQIDHTICGDLQHGLNREWLVTNGIGGYASGSLLGATTRSYHGLLVAALHPPVERTVLVAKLD